MNTAGNDVTVQCPRGRLVLILLGIPVLIFVILVLIWTISVGPIVLAKKFDLQFFLTAYLLFPVLIVAFSWVVWTIIRYREALFTILTVSDSGVLVQNSRYGALLLNWDEISAVYYSFGKMVILQSQKLARPLAIMSFSKGGPAPEFVAAKAIIERHLGARWSDRKLII